MTTVKVLAGMVAGMAIGAALGILMAPHKGAKTRKNIVSKGEDLAKNINKKIDEKFSDLVNTVSGARDAVAHAK